jgi:CO dehydrogenase maturation factor
MTITIAIAGKGGTGKTTLAALLVRHLVAHRLGRVLAVDADPSSNLHLLLGLPLTKTVGDLREAARDEVPAGMSRWEWLAYAVRLCVEEGDRLDLLAMGRPEGPGCYCAPNHVLRTLLDGICATYDFVVVDNEAGMEHLSRRTTRDVDHLLLVSDASPRALSAAEAMLALSQTLHINVRHTGLALNRVRGELSPPFAARLAELKVPLLATLADDPLLADYDRAGRSLLELPSDAPAARVVERLVSRLIVAVAEVA